jgi:hypothetical protein
VIVLAVFERIHLFWVVGQVPATFKSMILPTCSFTVQFLVQSVITVVDCARAVAILAAAVVTRSKVVIQGTQRIVLLPLCVASVLPAIVTTSPVL